MPSRWRTRYSCVFREGSRALVALCVRCGCCYVWQFNRRNGFVCCLGTAAAVPELRRKSCALQPPEHSHGRLSLLLRSDGQDGQVSLERRVVGRWRGVSPAQRQQVPHCKFSPRGPFRSTLNIGGAVVKALQQRQSQLSTTGRQWEMSRSRGRASVGDPPQAHGLALHPPTLFVCRAVAVWWQKSRSTSNRRPLPYCTRTHHSTRPPNIILVHFNADEGILPCCCLWKE